MEINTGGRHRDLDREPVGGDGGPRIRHEEAIFASGGGGVDVTCHGHVARTGKRAQARFMLRRINHPQQMRGWGPIPCFARGFRQRPVVDDI